MPPSEVAAPKGTATDQLAKAATQSSATRDYLAWTLGDTEGWLCTAFGYGGHMVEKPNGKLKYEHDKWIPHFYEWPAEADRAVRELTQEAHLADAYLCPNVMRYAKRTEKQSVSRLVVHADADSGLDLDKARELGAFVVASGSPGHVHVYVPLTESVPLEWHRALQEGMRAAFDGDDKIADNDVLRPVGTFNRKPVCDGGDPAPVTWLMPPNGERVEPHALAFSLGVVLSEARDGLPTENAALQQVTISPADSTWAKFPSVMQAVALVTGDRSEDSYRILTAAYDASLLRLEAYAAVLSRKDLSDRLDERTDNDLDRMWLKIVDNRHNERWCDALGRQAAAAVGDDGPALTSWEPFDLGPYVRGEVELPKPSVGISRSDGLRLLYAGREHAAIGETESGKTWLALQCTAVELLAGNTVVYFHYEESEPSSTIERLGLLGVPADVTLARLRFVAPSQKLANVEWLDALLRDPAPTLVVHDGVNEAMTLHGLDLYSGEGAATFRRWLVKPATRVGAAVLSCDHVPKNRDGQGRDAYGSVHKGNALDGARFVFENVEPFGRDMRGRSNVFVTKDRPGHLRNYGRPSKLPGKTFIGTLVADDADPFEPFSLALYAPKGDDEPTADASGLADAMFDVIAAQPDRTVRSARQLHAAMRANGHTVRDDAYREAVDDLVIAGRVEEVRGKRGAVGYRAVATASGEETS